jgi:hypothetical protein
MKNVRDEELPFEDVEGKQKWYAAWKPIPSPIQRSLSGSLALIPGKDTSFFEKLLPFVKMNGIKTVLDVGADQGKYSVWFWENGLSVTSSELVEDRAELLKYCYQQEGIVGINVITQDIEEVSVDEMGRYDLVFMSDLVEHLIDWKTAMNTVAQNCKYAYMLIPGERSWDWSPDHLQIFDDAKIEELTNIFNGIVFVDRMDYDGTLWWYSILVKGFA